MQLQAKIQLPSFKMEAEFLLAAAFVVNDAAAKSGR